MKELINYLLTESEVFTGKSQTPALPYWPNDSRQYGKANAWDSWDSVHAVLNKPNKC